MGLNTAALGRFGIDQACAEKWGPAVVRVREDGTPTGYILEGPVFDIMKPIAYTREQMKGFLLWFQDFMLSMGYTGVKRWSDHGKMVRLLKALDAHGLNIHAHAIGDGASGFMIGAIEEAQAATGNYDMRNALAHLHVVDPADRARIADNNIVACVGLMWTNAIGSYAGSSYEQELDYLGAGRVRNTYPGQSLILLRARSEGVQLADSKQSNSPIHAIMALEVMTRCRVERTRSCLPTATFRESRTACWNGRYGHPAP